MSLFPARMKIQSKMKALECSQHLFYCKSMGIFSDSQGQLTPQIRLNLELSQDFMVVLVICKNKEDSIKNEGATVFTTLYIDFPDAQGQITPESVVVSGRNLNSSKLSCMSSSPARMKMIQSKMKGLKWSQHFPILSLWRFLQTFKGS